MERPGKHLLICILSLLLAVAWGCEGWLWVQHRAQARRALAALERKVQERDWLARQSPAPSTENEQAIAEDLVETRKIRSALQAVLREGEAGVPAAPPGGAIDLFFDLAAFVEKTRTLAARAGVELKPDERFGFAAHTNEAPAAEWVPAVRRQRLAAQQLIEALIEAQPRSLLAVQRERPLAAAQRSPRDLTPAGGEAAGAGASSGDFFDLEPALTVRVPGLVDSDAFRLEFTGGTATLREFLNALANARPPVIVRNVEVEPLAEDAPVKAPVASAGAPVPVVARSLSRFAVVVEAVRLADAAGEPTP